ncbi:dGTPase [Pseudoxanthobacter soli DSM 19599]|uniref:Deoxyguanosinetriphosphate triphosphohydrolase-like protein n=1 Tax=Pseudoxanthobacter soli DSM 19599 TaxID=1123029 RepID=A0A1M7Z6F5_9HYPH|nr:deoxyguanosinetriphosphate triphosphohydrolase [Pseudoxanthobacter soli]SHO60513.1 dGTPase [Pseudoxanthobacter soli DSM 19599]
MRAPFAADPARSRGTRVPEPLPGSRTLFQRDRDRILHSSAFRRLTHKTQVFFSHEGDHFRTRLTHTLEVAQIARSIARTLGLDEDLTETVALAHDLGHTPFGHEGEDVLDACLEGYGGFDHNAQSLRIVTRLERRYAAFDGLNLSWEALEGIVKHNGPLVAPDGTPIGRYAGRPLPHALLAHDATPDLDLHTFPSLEAQVAAISDDIAYDAHDIDDGLRAGLFPVEELEAVPLVSGILTDVRIAYPGLDRPRLAHEITRRLVGALVEDVLAETRSRLSEARPASADAVRAQPRALAAFSPGMVPTERAIKTFLFQRMYRNPEVTAIRREAGRVLRDLFAAFRAEPHAMPEAWCEAIDHCSEAEKLRRIADYIAGMTDRYALQTHRRLFDDTPELR